MRALRQWLRVIVALTLIGFLAAVLSWANPTTGYAATRTLGPTDASSTNAASLNRAAFLSTDAEVVRQVAAKIGGDPGQIAASITATADPDLNGVSITATAATPGRAVLVVTTVANRLVEVLDEQAQSAYDTAVEKANTDLANAKAILATNPSAAAEKNVADAQSEVNTLATNGPPSLGLRTLGSTSVVSTGEGTSRAARAAVGGFMGLLLGVIVALLLARFDTRIRTKDRAEEAFGVPVVAEIPVLRRKARKARAIITTSDPESLAAEAYRALRTAVVVATGSRQSDEAAPRSGNRRRGKSEPAPPPRSRKGRVVMVVSPGMNEGKTTSTANLAVAFGETGRTVLMLGCDLRRPELHAFFGLSESPGLTDVLAEQGPNRSLDTVIRDTGYPGVRIATSGDPVKHPGEFLTRGLDLIESARSRADVVLIDTAPLLATDDASVLMPLVDSVVVVCRSGLTRNEAARRARELLNRLQAPLVGVALVGADQLASARSYYRYRSEYRSRAPSVVKPGPPAPPVDVNGAQAPPIVRPEEDRVDGLIGWAEPPDAPAPAPAAIVDLPAVSEPNPASENGEAHDESLHPPADS